MTRKERFQRERERAKIRQIGGEGLKVEAPDEIRCDACGEPHGTLYPVDGRMLCYGDLPFQYAHGSKSGKLLSLARSGKAAIVSARRELAHQH